MNGFVRMMLAQVNGMYQQWMRFRRVGLPDGVEASGEFSYLDDGKDCHKMVFYRPMGQAGSLPVIVNFHGGGMVLCTKEVNAPFCAALASRGYLVCNVDYPLVPDTDVLGILGDVCSALDKLYEMIPQFGGDLDRVFLVGDSAGAFLSVYAAAIGRNPQLSRDTGIPAPRLSARALGLISGMFCTGRLDGTGIFLRSSFYGKNWRKNPLWPYVKPEKVAGDLPPCFLVTAKADQLRRDTMRLRKGLKKQGITHEILDFPWKMALGHDFVIMDPNREEACYAIDRMDAFFRGI